MNGAVFAPGEFRALSHTGRLSPGWRRAYRLAGASLALGKPADARAGADPLDMGEKSAIVKSVDASVPPEQPPSTVDSPSRVSRLGLSATGIAFDLPSAPVTTHLSAQVSAASPGCGVTPSGLTY
jgi:hypothetical protein